MNRVILLGLASALALAGCGSGDKSGESKTPEVKAAAGQVWSETTARTVEGGMVMGNPAAAVKLVEYGALTCSHCADFSKTGMAGLRKYVDKGTVSYEFRSFLLNAIDIPANLAARCGGPGPFFAIAEGLYETQPEWLGKTQTFTEAEGKQLSTLPPEQAAPIIAAKLGLDTFVQQRGVSSEKLKACLTDKKEIDALVAITTKGSNEMNVKSTPNFFINGVKMEDVYNWETLEPKLKDAGA